MLIIHLVFLLRLHLTGEIIFFFIFYIRYQPWRKLACFLLLECSKKLYSQVFFPSCNYLRKWFLAYVILGLLDFMLNFAALAWKHFLFLEESPSGSNSLCYSSMMTFCGSFRVSLGRWYKFTLSLCYSVLKPFPCHLWAVCRMFRRQTSVNNIFEGKKEILCYRCSCVWWYLRLGFTSWKTLSYSFQNELRQTLMVGLYELQGFFPNLNNSMILWLNSH